MYGYEKNVLHDKISLLRKGECLECSYVVNSDEKMNCRLFFTCEDALCPTMKNESGAELCYMLIDDSLNFEKAEKNRYCLDLSCRKPYPFAKRIMKKIRWSPLIYGLYDYDDFSDYKNNWSFGVSAKAENLVIHDGGYLRIRIDRWQKCGNKEVKDTTGEPAETFVIDIPCGTYPMTEYKSDLTINREDTACVIVTIEGKGYEGEVYFESPFLCDFEERNFLPDFDRGSLGLKSFAWFGQNLSKREWPLFEIAVNGKTFFDDEVFLKVHRFSPIEIDIPDDLINKGENIISIKYKSDYLDTIPVNIGEVILLRKEKTPFSLVRCPEEVITDEPLKLLVETQNDSTELVFLSDDFRLVKSKSFEGKKLQVLTVENVKEKNNLSFNLSCGDYIQEYTVKRCVRRIEDNVIAGSGDMIYIDITNPKQVCDYVKWYVANDVGKLITIRPVYRWGGQRHVNGEVWEFFTDICSEIGLLYVNISDGRDIPGIAANPSFDMLNGENFLGRQLHERDGQLFYWSPGVGRPREVFSELDEFFDLALRTAREEPEFIEGAMREENISYRDGIYSSRRDFSKNHDFEECSAIVADEVKFLSSDNFIRHTGPSVMFKYFYENGFKWLGAETMDGATEMLLAFLRGASDSFDKEKYGVHLALQWSTFPHNTMQRYRRYLLSLYIPYMHGVTDINTEEGLWFIEARFDYYNRLSEVCENHRIQKRRFNKFVRTHSRQGKFYTPVAFLHGRNDGWNGFYVSNLWGMPHISAGEESKGWKLLSHFYPLNTLEDYGMVKTGCILPDNDKPFGLFSGTPNGQVDVVPVEKGDLSKYKTLIFAGYNTADDNDFDRLYDYVENGGMLLLTWAHLTDTTLKSDIDSYNLNIKEHKLTKLLSVGKPEFVSGTKDKKELKVCANLSNCGVLEKTDSGDALVCCFTVGKGKIILVNTLYYPGNDTVYPVYSKLVEKFSIDAHKEDVLSVSCGNDVEYTVFKKENGGYDYYFTAVDWYNNSEKPRNCVITADGYSFNLEIPFGEIVKLSYADNIIVWPETDDTEIISVSKDRFTVQGEGKKIVFVVKDGKTEKYTVDFFDAVKEIEFNG